MPQLRNDEYILSRLFYPATIVLPVLERTHANIEYFRKRLSIFYVYNGNTSGGHLQRDKLRLLESGNTILANNFFTFVK